MSFIMTIIYFLILIGAVIFVHELGHFMCAKAFNIKVTHFSMGFGPKLFGFTRGETEYQVSAFPVGGYVKMIGEDPNAEINPEDRARSFLAQPPYKRLLVAVAGPGMNMIFPVFLFFAVYLASNQVVPAYVGHAIEGSPAWEAGLKPGDVITAVDGKPIHSFEDLQGYVEPAYGRPLGFTVRRGQETFRLSITPKKEILSDPLESGRPVGRIGILPSSIGPVIGVRSSDSPAGQAGLRTFDRITAVNGKKVESFNKIISLLQSSAGKETEISYLRPDIEKMKPPFADVYSGNEQKTMLTPRMEGERLLTGIEPSILYVSHVEPESRADAIGIKSGDRLVSLDGEPLRIWSQLLWKLQAEPQKARTLVWEHDGSTKENGSYYAKPLDPSQGGALGSELFEPGLRTYAPMNPPGLINHPHRVARATRLAFTQTWNMSRLIVIGIVRLIQGRISLNNIGGPIMIGDLAAEAGSRGIGTFLWFMALISINLGLVNLLPIPVLDGGHLFMSLIEWVRKKPLNLRTREIAHIIGLALLVSLMAYAIKNDIVRIWPRLTTWLSSLFG